MTEREWNEATRRMEWCGITLDCVRRYVAAVSPLRGGHVVLVKESGLGYSKPQIIRPAPPDLEAVV